MIFNIQPDQKSWVFEGIEVTKTGRKAQRALPSGKLDIQIEVTPVHNINGSWKKWTRESDLFEIINEPTNT